MNDLGTDPRPLRVAIIGSGPSGFYAAERLFKSEKKVQVDMFERLPAPFGLVRYGVAPDHQKIKSVIRIYEKTATHPGFSFYGNVDVGRDFPVADLRRYYDAVIFASGAGTDCRLGIPGEDLAGSHTATEFVAWYNGHPDFRDRQFDLSGETAFIIGQGNVAMDVSRILAKSVDELKDTDICQHALDALAESRIKTVYLIGRRGPVQAAFTEPEIKEMGRLATSDVFVDPGEMELNPASQLELIDPGNKHAQKNYAVLREYAGRTPTGKTRRLIIRFFLSPVEFSGNDRVQTIRFEKNSLSGKPFRQKAAGTGQFEELPCNLVFRSVGYRGIAITGVPFDEKNGVFPNQEGRLVDQGAVVPGLYAVGWIKRGPSGVIGTNKPDSLATVQSLLADVETLPEVSHPEPSAVHSFLEQKGIRAVSYEDWKKIDAEEIRRGASAGKPREKFTSVPEMLSCLKS